MNLIQGWPKGRNNTLLQQLALANGHRADRIDGFDTLFDGFLELAVEKGHLHVGVGVLRSKGDDDFSSAPSHVLLDRGLHALLGDDQRLHSNEVTVGGHHIDHIVDLSTVPTNLTSDVVGLMVMADEHGQSILSYALRHSEAHDDMHLGEVAVKLLLGHFVDATDDMLIGLTDGLANAFEVPRVTGSTDGVPSLHLPLVTLFTRCCACLCTHFLRHVNPLGVS